MLLITMFCLYSRGVLESWHEVCLAWGPCEMASVREFARDEMRCRRGSPASILFLRKSQHLQNGAFPQSALPGVSPYDDRSSREGVACHNERCGLKEVLPSPRFSEPFALGARTPSQQHVPGEQVMPGSRGHTFSPVSQSHPRSAASNPPLLEGQVRGGRQSNCF